MEITRYKTFSYKEEIPKKLMDFKKWEFTTGITTGKDFNSFSRKFKNYIKKNLPDNLELVEFSKGHYILSGFIKNKDNNKYVYFSISDVRFFKNSWANNILIRTAKNKKDYTGGSNNYTTIESFVKSVKELLT